MSSRVTLVCRTHGLGERSTDALLTRAIGRDKYTVSNKQQRKPPFAVPREEPQARLFA